MADEDDKDEDGGKWYSWFGYGAVLFALSGFLWWYLTDFETKGGTRRVHWLIAILYNTLGKTATVAVFAVLGVVMCVIGVMALMKKKKPAAT